MICYVSSSRCRTKADIYTGEIASTDSLGRRTGPRRQYTLEEKRQIVKETHVVVRCSLIRHVPEFKPRVVGSSMILTIYRIDSGALR